MMSNNLSNFNLTKSHFQSNFLNCVYFTQRKQKKSGFGLFGLFKKKGGKQPGSGKERPKSSYVPRDDWSPSSRSPSTSPHNRSPAMMPRSQSQPFIEKPGNAAFASSIPDMTSSPLTQRRHQEDGEPDLERLPTPPPAPLQT